MFAASIHPRTPGRGGVGELTAQLTSIKPLSGDAQWDQLVGGEVLGVMSDPDAVIDCARVVVRTGGWNLGVGAGEVTAPWPEHLGRADGEAFVLARRAATRASSRRAIAPVAVEGLGAIAAADAEALLSILSHQWSARTQAGWEAVEAIRHGGASLPQQVVASRLGITQQALSQRLRAAGWAAERGILPLLRRRLLASAGSRGPGF